MVSLTRFPMILAACALVLPLNAAMAKTDAPHPSLVLPDLSWWTDDASGAARHAVGPLSFKVPGGWEVTRDEGEKTHQLRAVCRTQACRRSQESCSVVVVKKRLLGLSRLSGHFVGAMWGAQKAKESAFKFYSDPANATLQREGETEWLGGRSFLTVELDGSPRHKSLLQANTIVANHWVRVRCSTCLRGPDQFDFARDFIASLQHEGAVVAEATHEPNHHE